MVPLSLWVILLASLVKRTHLELFLLFIVGALVTYGVDGSR